jgi:hypothetical protein
MRAFFQLAQLQDLNPFKPGSSVPESTGLVFEGVLPIIGAGLVLGLILLLGVKIAMRRGRRRRQHHHHHASPAANPIVPVLPKDDEDEDGRPSRRRRRKRHRRREHRPRNPTLAETGGLPVSKSEPSSNPPL